MKTKHLVIAGVIIAGGIIAYKWYQNKKSKEAIPPTASKKAEEPLVEFAGGRSGR